MNRLTTIKKNKLMHLVSIILFSLSVVICLCYFLSTQSKSVAGSDTTCVSLQENWKIETASKTFFPSELPVHIKAPPNEIVTATLTLPYTLPHTAAIYFRSSQQSVIVLLNDKIIYQYDTKGLRPFGKASASHWNFIQIPSEYAGGELQIKTVSPYHRFSGQLLDVKFGSYPDLMNDLYSGHLVGYLICILLFILGIIMIVASYLIAKLNKQIIVFHYLGFFTLFMTFWMYAEAKFPPFWIRGTSLEHIIASLAIMLCPLPFLLFIKFYFPPRYHRFLTILFIAFSLNFILCVGLQILQIADFIETIFITYILIFLTALLICVQFWMQMKKKEKISYISLFGFVVLLLNIMIQLFLCYRKQYTYTSVYFLLGIFIYVFCLIIFVIQNMFAQKALNSFLSEKLLKQQINMMISHIQPHFLFNSLGAIQSLIKKAPDTAYQMMFDFSKYLRSSMLAWENPAPIPLSMELEYTRAFSNIQLIRFRNSFHVIYDIETEDFSVPILSVRALVENAVNHGVRKASNQGTVLIKSYGLPDRYVIEVTDDGIGFDVEKTLSQCNQSSGLHRVHYYLKNDLNAALEINSTPGKGTTVIISIPK